MSSMSDSIFKRRKWSMIRILTALFVISVVSIYILLQLYVPTTPKPYFLNRTVTESISCYFSSEADALPAAEGLSPSAHSIFFHETSCLGGLDSRQACAVESAARMHPERSIYVLFNSPVTETVLDRSCLAKLMQFRNVQLARVHIAEYAQQTALADLLGQARNNQSQWKDLSDLLKYVTVYKYGGVYLDMDILLVKPLDQLGADWVTREDDFILNAAAFAASKEGIGNDVISTVLNHLEWNFQPNDWRNNGFGALNRAVLEFCASQANIVVTNTSDFTCKGFTVYNPLVFYPIPVDDAIDFFKTGPVPEATRETAYAYHLWNKFTSKLKVMAGSPYDRLSREYCPSIIQMYGARFGS